MLFRLSLFVLFCEDRPFTECAAHGDACSDGTAQHLRCERNFHLLESTRRYVPLGQLGRTAKLSLPLGFLELSDMVPRYRLFINCDILFEEGVPQALREVEEV